MRIDHAAFPLALTNLLFSAVWSCVAANFRNFSASVSGHRFSVRQHLKIFLRALPLLHSDLYFCHTSNSTPWSTAMCSTSHVKNPEK